MERFMFVKCKTVPVTAVRLSNRSYSILHQTRANYVKSFFGAEKCRDCGTRRSHFSQFSITKKELKAWKSIIQGSGILQRQASALYTGSQRWFSQQQNPGEKGEKGEQDGKPPPKQPEMNTWSLIGGIVGLLVWLLFTRQIYNDKLEMSWSTFEKDFLLKGQVEKLHILKMQNNEQVIDTELHPDSEYRRKVGKRIVQIKYVSRDDFAENVRDFEQRYKIPENEKIPITFSKEPTYLQPMVSLLLILALVALFARGRRSINKDVESQIKFSSTNLKDASGMKANKKDVVTFAQIAGQKEAMVELKEFVDYITRPLKYQKMGAKVPRGALLTGPPGCGKTLLAKALAGESKVPFYAMAGSEFIEIFGGLGASRIRDLFKKARANAPCIIYIDEIDTIGRSRQGGGSRQSEGLSSETESTLNQLLVEMDGMTTTDGVIVLASTNRAEILDKALLRPGRFDRHILIDLPTLKEREELYQLYLSNIKLETTQLDAIISRLALMTPGMSGADIANVCNEAAIHAARLMKTSVGESDLDYAIERVVAGVAKSSRTMSHAERKILAYHEAGHVIAKCFLEGVDKLLKVSIVPRTSDKPSFSRFAPSDRKLHSKEDLFTEICVALAGRASEAIVFNKITTAAEDDLKRVTKIAYNQIKTWGMNTAVGLMSFPTDEEVGSAFGKKPYSKLLKNTIDQEAERIVADAYRETQMLLKLHRINLDKIANELIEKETLNKDEIKVLLGFPTDDVKQKKEMPTHLL